MKRGAAKYGSITVRGPHNISHCWGPILCVFMVPVLGSRSVPGLGFELDGEGGPFIGTTTSLSYLTRWEGPTTLKVERRQWSPRLSGEKLEHHIQADPCPNQHPFSSDYSPAPREAVLCDKDT